MKKKIIFYGIVMLLMALSAFYLARWMHLLLAKESINMANMLPHVIIADMRANVKQQILFACMLVMMGLLFILILMSGNNGYYKSELDAITPEIQTPRKIGQGQHGTACWLKKDEYAKTFASHTIAPKGDKIVKNLMKYGHEDIKAVSDYKIQD